MDSAAPPVTRMALDPGCRVRARWIPGREAFPAPKAMMLSLLIGTKKLIERVCKLAFSPGNRWSKPDAAVAILSAPKLATPCGW